MLISSSEARDGSGWPPDYEDMESGDVVFPGEPEGLDRALLTPRGHRAHILVRHRHQTPHITHHTSHIRHRQRQETYPTVNLSEKHKLLISSDANDHS